MKYIVFASMLSLLSVNSFALGQNSSPDKNCCTKEGGGCRGQSGNMLPQCGLSRSGLKRETSSKKPPGSFKSSKAKAKVE